MYHYEREPKVKRCVAIGAWSVGRWERYRTPIIWEWVVDESPELVLPLCTIAITESLDESESLTGVIDIACQSEGQAFLRDTLCERPF